MSSSSIVAGRPRRRGTFGGRPSIRTPRGSARAASPRRGPARPTAKLTIRSRSASDSRTSATVAPGIADAHRLVRIACVFTYARERGGVLATRVAGAAAPPLVGLRNSDTECIQIVVERPVVRAGEHELRDPQRVRVLLPRPLMDERMEDVHAREVEHLEPREHVRRERVEVRLQLVDLALQRREHRQRVRHQSFASDRNRSYAALNSSGPSRSASRSSASKRSRTASAFWTIRVLASACAQ